MSEWRERAACRIAVKAGEAIPDWWFPAGEPSEVTQAQQNARRICATCPVKTPCLTENIDEPYGIYGGQGERRRRGIRQGERPIEPRPIIRDCEECGREFETGAASRTNVCSKQCRETRHRRKQQESYEIRTGRIPDHEGSRRRYMAGCRCSRCREAERLYRREYRAAQRARKADVA